MVWFGLISPIVAVAGDFLLAINFDVLLVLPSRLAWRRITRPLERKVWQLRLSGMDEEVLAEIHNYWLGPFSSPTYLPEDRKGIWFTQSHATDAYIRAHFLQAVVVAAAIDWDTGILTH